MIGHFPEPGRIFEDKYQVEKLLGSGGFARVYLAEQIDLGRKVAIKILSLKLPGGMEPSQGNLDPHVESVARRFEREARVVSQLRSPQTITIYDYGRTADGLLYMVMEFVDGVEIDDIPLPIAPRRVTHILRQVLQSLREAHSHGLLHRDLKPANIMLYSHLGQKDQVKLLDFGIAKMIGEVANESSADLTATDSLIGTPRYMSPEQIRGHDIGPPSDIYSLGLVAYELLMGEKAITNSDSIEILGKHLSAESFVIPPTQAIHPQLRALVNKMLAKDLDRRYASTEEVLAELDALEKIPGDLRLGGPPPPGQTLDSALGVAAVPMLDDSFIEPLDDSLIELLEPDDSIPMQAGRANRTMLLAVGALALVAVVVGTWLLTRPTPQPPAAPEPAPAKVTPRAAPVVTLIRTRPDGASVWLNEQLIGMAPVQFDSDRYDFPIEIRATLGEQSMTTQLEAPGGEIWLDIPQPEVLAKHIVDEEEQAVEREDAREADEAAKTTRPTRPSGNAPRPTLPVTSSKKPSDARPAAKDNATKNTAANSSAASDNTDSPKSSTDTPAKPSVDTLKYLPLD